MGSGFVRLIGTVDDMYGVPVSVGVDYGAVTIRGHGVILGHAAAAEFAALLARARADADTDRALLDGQEGDGG